LRPRRPLSSSENRPLVAHPDRRLAQLFASRPSRAYAPYFGDGQAVVEREKAVEVYFRSSHDRSPYHSSSSINQPPRTSSASYGPSSTMDRNCYLFTGAHEKTYLLTSHCDRLPEGTLRLEAALPQLTPKLTPRPMDSAGRTRTGRTIFLSNPFAPVQARPYRMAFP
jgi:hypothetical protein